MTDYFFMNRYQQTKTILQNGGIIMKEIVFLLIINSHPNYFMQLKHV